MPAAAPPHFTHIARARRIALARLAHVGVIRLEKTGQETGGSVADEDCEKSAGHDLSRSGVRGVGFVLARARRRAASRVSLGLWRLALCRRSQREPPAPSRVQD